MHERYDIGIVGGGMVGSLAAKVLSSHFKVVLVEPRSLHAAFFGETPALPPLRVSALNGNSAALLRQEGILDQIAPSHLSEILAMKLFDGDEALNFHASDIGQVRLGYIVENEALNQAILNTLPEESVTWHHSACKAVSRHLEGFLLEAEDGSTHLVKLLIVAQGAMSSLRQALGVPVSMNDYNQNAWVTSIETEKPHGHTAYQRFLPTGTLAFLPLANPHWSSIVWTLPASKSFDGDFLPQLQAVFPDLGSLKLLTEPVSFPLCAQNAESYAGSGFVLLGDTAHTVHPLAGQGVNLGFRDAVLLAQVLIDAQNKKEDWASPAVLKRYARKARRHDSLRSVGFSLINRAYQEQNPFFVALRQWGMQGLSRMDLLKRLLMKQA